MGLTRLTQGDAHPSWSPNGRRIVFSSTHNGNVEIFDINADGTGLANLTNNPAMDSSPAWSPDGTRIAFGTTRDTNWGGEPSANDEIYVMNADGSGQTNVTNNPAYDGRPTWCP